MKTKITPEEQKAIFKEHYERLDLEDLLKQGKQHLENNVHHQAIQWNSFFWKLVWVGTFLAIICIASVYGYVIYKTYIAAEQYEINQQKAYKKALGEPNEN